MHTQAGAGGDSHGKQMHFRTGDTIDKDYLVMQTLGSGGAGQVYLVNQIALQRQAALKVLTVSSQDNQAWRRFYNEAQLIGKMSHPNIIRVFNFGMHQERLPYYVMEVVEGDTLDSSIKKYGAIGTLEACELFLDIASALSYAHEKGVVHRDIKPGNIVLVDAVGGRGYKAKLLDFGIAKLTGKQDYKQQEITHAGEVVGSPLYMSPEQCSGGEVDERSDVYSLGCTIYETMTGTPPFRGQNVMETVMKHFQEKPPTLASRMPGEYIPPRLEQLIQKSMAKDPGERYQTMLQMGRELEDIRRTLEINLNADQQEAARKAVNTTINIEGPDKREKIREENNRRRIIKISAISLGILLLIFGGWQGYTAYQLKTQTKKVQLSEASGLTMAKGLTTPQPKLPDAPAQGSYLQQPVEIIGEKPNQIIMRHYKFRPTPPIGKFEIQSHPKFIDQTLVNPDEMEVPLGRLVRFYPSAEFLSHPELFQGFDATALTVINFAGDFSSKANTIMMDSNMGECLKNITHIQAIHSLNMVESSLSDNDLSTLDKLKKLRHLNIDRTEVTCPGLAEHAEMLQNLESFTSEDLPGPVKPLVEVLSQSKELRMLGMRSNDLTLEDCKLLGESRSIHYLSLIKCGITDDGIKLICQNPNIISLTIRENPVTPDSIPVFAKLKNLTSIDVGPGCDWHAGTIKKLKAAIVPTAKIFWHGEGRIPQECKSTLPKPKSEP